MKKTLVLSMALIGGLALGAERAAAWDLVGVQTVSRGKDRDTVQVRGNERHRQFRVCVVTGGLRMYDMDIVFANGGRQDVPLRRNFAAGTCSRAVDLKGNRRNIERVVVRYERAKRNRLPIVSFWAR